MKTLPCRKRHAGSRARGASLAPLRWIEITTEDPPVNALQEAGLGTTPCDEFPEKSELRYTSRGKYQMSAFRQGRPATRASRPTDDGRATRMKFLPAMGRNCFASAPSQVRKGGAVSGLAVEAAGHRHLLAIGKRAKDRLPVSIDMARMEFARAPGSSRFTVRPSRSAARSAPFAQRFFSGGGIRGRTRHLPPSNRFQYFGLLRL
jgi:hypothetical protein